MGTVVENPIESVVSERPLLRRGKYYRRATNGGCSSCRHGMTGCCNPHLDFQKDDFAIDFSSEDEVKKLMSLGVFGFKYTISSDCTYARVFILSREIRLRKAKYEWDGYVCLFWSKDGCRLAYDAKPEVCRMHYCSQIEDGMREFNLPRKKKQSARCSNQWTFEECMNIRKCLIDLGLHDAEGTRFVHYSEEESNNLDWNTILLALQGTR